MASTGRSRWGNLLSQAVAGVEARLDTILADEEGSAQAPKAQEQTDSKPPLSPKPSTTTSRTNSTNRTNDRLQERLARAMAAKAAQKEAPRSSMSTQPSPRQSLDTPSRASTDSIAPANVDVVTQDTSVTESHLSQEPVSEETPAVTEKTNGDYTNKEEPDVPDVPDVKNEVEEKTVVHEAPVVEPGMAIPIKDELNHDHSSEETSAQPDQAAEPQTALEAAQLQHQEETHAYVERIDALEAKLQFLAREATESARKAALAAPAGSVEKKLAEKDQQIAQLMEEGKNLASTEQKHRTIMKKLRAKIADDEKEINTTKLAKERTDRELETLRRKARRADELEKEHDALQRKLTQTQRELNTMRPEFESRKATIAELKTQLHRATEQADAMTAKVNDQAREQDKKRIADLEETVASLQVEKNLVVDRSKAHENDLREKLERAAERTRALELEMKAEVQVMESKLEAMRIRTEEASSGAIGDSQAKLLRQVETLQTQYSIASENWQGIETTLQARIASLERERDEALQRESDMRKKAREASLRAKRNEEELEEVRNKVPDMQKDVVSYQTQIDALKKRADEAEAALVEARAEFEKQKQAWQEEKEEKQSRPTPTERRSWLEDLPSAPFRSESRPASPLLSAPQRTLSSDLLGIQPISKARKHSAPSANNSDAGLGTSLRRPSGQPPLRPSILSPSATSLHSSFGAGMLDALPTPSTHPLERDDGFDGLETSSSPRQVLQDMVSVSTVAAGPSVQLVERMSAGIRRLESEKVAAREELARLSSQRDEARAEIVALMRTIEGHQAAAARVPALEAEVADVNARYETTLELLGEKSEMVDELRADIQDMKQMYRELVERTVK